MNSLLSDIRGSIKEGKFSTFREKFLAAYKTSDEDRRIEQKIRSVEAKRRKGVEDFQ